MAQEISLSSLRANIYRIFDDILESGQPVTVVRNGKKLTIAAEEKVGRLSKLKIRKVVKGDSSKIDKVTWQWKPKDDLR